MKLRPGVSALVLVSFVVNCTLATLPEARANPVPGPAKSYQSATGNSRVPLAICAQDAQSSDAGFSKVPSNYVRFGDPQSHQWAWFGDGHVYLDVWIGSYRRLLTFNVSAQQLVPSKKWLLVIPRPDSKSATPRIGVIAADQFTTNGLASLIYLPFPGSYQIHRAVFDVNGDLNLFLRDSSHPNEPVHLEVVKQDLFAKMVDARSTQVGLGIVARQAGPEISVAIDKFQKQMDQSQNEINTVLHAMVPEMDDPKTIKALPVQFSLPKAQHIVDDWEKLVTDERLTKFQAAEAQHLTDSYLELEHTIAPYFAPENFARLVHQECERYHFEPHKFLDHATSGLTSTQVRNASIFFALMTAFTITPFFLRGGKIMGAAGRFAVSWTEYLRMSMVRASLQRMAPEFMQEASDMAYDLSRIKSLPAEKLAAQGLSKEMVYPPRDWPGLRRLKYRLGMWISTWGANRSAMLTTNSYYFHQAWMESIGNIWMVFFSEWTNKGLFAQEDDDPKEERIFARTSAERKDYVAGIHANFIWRMFSNGFFGTMSLSYSAAHRNFESVRDLERVLEEKQMALEAERGFRMTETESENFIRDQLRARNPVWQQGRFGDAESWKNYFKNFSGQFHGENKEILIKKLKWGEKLTLTKIPAGLKQSLVTQLATRGGVFSPSLFFYGVGFNFFSNPAAYTFRRLFFETTPLSLGQTIRRQNENAIVFALFFSGMTSFLYGWGMHALIEERKIHWAPLQWMNGVDVKDLWRHSDQLPKMPKMPIMNQPPPQSQPNQNPEDAPSNDSKNPLTASR